VSRKSFIRARDGAFGSSDPCTRAKSSSDGTTVYPYEPDFSTGSIGFACDPVSALLDSVDDR